MLHGRNIADVVEASLVQRILFKKEIILLDKEFFRSGRSQHTIKEANTGTKMQT